MSSFLLAALSPVQRQLSPKDEGSEGLLEKIKGITAPLWHELSQHCGAFETRTILSLSLGMLGELLSWCLSAWAAEGCRVLGSSGCFLRRLGDFPTLLGVPTPLVMHLSLCSYEGTVILG